MVYGFDMDTMPQTVPTADGFSPTFDYTTFQFDLSLLPDDYGVLGNQSCLKAPQIKQEACSPRPNSPTTYPSPPYPGLGELSPNYSRDASPAYPTSPYYVPQSPQSAQFYPTSPEPTKQPVKREKSLDLLAILQESRLLAESLGYKEDSTDCTVPCTPPRTEEDIYNSLDTDFFPKKDSNPLLKEILFKEERSTSSSMSVSSVSVSSPASTVSSSAPSPAYAELDRSPLRELLFKGIQKNLPEETSSTLKVEKYQEDLLSAKVEKFQEGLLLGKVEKFQEDLLLGKVEKFQEDLLLGKVEKFQEGLLLGKVEKFEEGILLGKTANPLEREEELFKDGRKSDHQLLREVLRDTSFQRKYNLRPVDLGGVGTGFVEDMEPEECVGDLTREQIEPVLSLAIQQLQKDFDNTCVALGIHPEPRRWSAADVAAWMQWARRQLQLPSVPLESFNVDGATLASLTEEEFCRRAPQCGSVLHAQLEIWKAAVEESPRNTLAASWSPAGVVQAPGSGNGSTASSASSTGPASVKGSCSIDYSDDEDEESGSTQTSSGGKMRNGGSHIHLWQFLKELLQSPGVHGSCIRWLDRNKGVFKIEDSVRVARLWGKRKNRPAMNYDKLSRSIRQYYKKGIMKKTERSQRLVYQFCHPYCL